MSRTIRLLGGAALDSHILEIGPSHNPIAPKAAGWRTHTVDHTDRDGLLDKYAGDPSVDLNRIEAVDTIWHDGPLHMAILTSLHGSFDRLIASHVIEHLPDLVSFLLSAQILLKPDGVMALAIPDRRYCFDYFKPPSLTGDVLEAFYLRRTRHSIRTAWNQFAYSATADGVSAWGQHSIHTLRLVDRLPSAGQAAERAIDANERDYEDFHTWHFTPATFTLTMLELGQIGLIDWHIESLHGPDGCEFIALLHRGTRHIYDDTELNTSRVDLLRSGLEEMQQQLDHLRGTLLTQANPSPKPKSISRLRAALSRMRPWRRPDRDEVKLLAHSGLFDRDWYLRQCGHDSRARSAPELHYLTEGAKAGLDPGPRFQTRWYLEAYDDVARSGMNPLLHYVTWGRFEGRLPIPFAEWMAAYGGPSAQAQAVPAGPLISVVMPVCDPPARYLRQALESVLEQQYGHWELCIADDASNRDEIHAMLAEFGDKPHVRIVRNSIRGGIAVASNAALALATGEYVALLDHDDVLPSHALAVVARCLVAEPDLDLVYSDEVVIDDQDRPIGGYFKSGYNRELLMAHNIVSHLGVYRRALVERVGGFRIGLDGSQDYDLALRVIAASAPERIRHIPQPLYLWRRTRGSFSDARSALCAGAARRAVAEFLRPRCPDVEVLPAPAVPLQNRVHFRLPKPAPRVSLILTVGQEMPNRQERIAALRESISYSDLQLIVLARRMGQIPGARIITTRHPEGTAARNEAAAVATGEVLVFLDATLSPDLPDWLEELTGQACRAEVGAVGAKLVSADMRVLHAGFALDPARIAVPLHYGAPAGGTGYHGQLVLQREVAAVSGACIAIRRAVFAESNGFDADAFPGAFYDVDFCLRARQRGLRIVWTPFASFQSPAAFGKQPPVPGARRAVSGMRARWAAQLAADPFDNPNLVPEGSGIAVPPRFLPGSAPVTRAT